MADPEPRRLEATRESARARAMPPAQLRALLGLARELDGRGNPALLAGLETADGGAVYRIDDDVAIAVTSSCSVPLLDDPFAWGRVAAAGALSRIYALGGAPFLALNLVAWPADELPLDRLARVIDGAASVVHGAGAVVAGGHTLDSADPAFGMAVCGRVHPRHVLSNATARPGNALVLTKPLGSGTVAAAMRSGVADDAVTAAAVDVMLVLNAGARDAALEVGVDAATDVGPLGLLGHLHELLVASGLAALVDAGRVPVLDGARELVGSGHSPREAHENLEFLEGATAWSGIPLEQRLVLADPQVSGGLLLAVDPGRSGALLTALRARGAHAVVVGHTVEGHPGHIGIQ